jgi:hypothetical protein
MYLTRIRSATKGPATKEQVHLAADSHNQNHSEAVGMTPTEASLPENELKVRAHQERRRMKMYSQNYEKYYSKVQEHKVGAYVLRRLREKGGVVGASGEKRNWVKESDPKYNISPTVYRVSRVWPTFPLKSYTLTELISGVTRPGRFTSIDLVKAPLTLIDEQTKDDNDEDDEHIDDETERLDQLLI